MMLKNIRKTKPITVYGMNNKGEGIRCDTIGDVLQFGEAYLCPTSLGNARAACDKVVFDHESNLYEVTTRDGSEYIFKKQDNIYCTYATFEKKQTSWCRRKKLKNLILSETSRDAWPTSLTMNSS
jgi:hypothetical protein